MQSSTVINKKEINIRCTDNDLIVVFTLENASSIGLKSGEYGI